MGLTRGTTRAHNFRAVLESIALQSMDLIEAMEKDCGVALAELRVDGGATRSAPLLQIQADLLQSKVVRPKETETTALGAAYLAGLGVGFWQSREEIEGNWEVDTVFLPQRPASELEKLKRDWLRGVKRAQRWVEEDSS